MTIARHSEGLFFDELSVLSTPSAGSHTTDVLVQFKNSDSYIYLALVVTSLMLVICVSLALNIRFISAFWMVFRVSLNQSNVTMLDKNSDK